MSTLRIQHCPSDGEEHFQVVRVGDSKTTKPVAVAPPVGFPVEGRPDSDLMRELRWYLEDFLGYPFPPETEHADRVLEALGKWGRQAFDALFDNRKAGDFLRGAMDQGRYDRLNLQIASDDPRVLAWPWEALEDSQAGRLAHTCQIERRLNEILDPAEIDEGLPRDRVNILLVTARPMKGDIRYRSISRPLVELIAEHRLPAHVTVLRPPTFDQLRRHLREHPRTYHVLHFDGHGGYGDHPDPGNVDRHRYVAQGVLVFEDENGEPNPIDAQQLSELLREHAVPAVVLNACQSAMQDERAEDPFASVAAALLKSGVRSVVAMAYTLYVSGARQFVPAFYEALFKTGNTAQAVRAGRQQMNAQRGRVCARGEYPLQDWLVAVVYQQDPLDFSFAAEAKQAAQPPESRLPEEARDENNPYGFIGRDGPLLELERAMLRPPAGILIQGLGGVGKTTLARGFVEWLEATNGLGEGCLWLTFSDIRSAEFVINRMGEPLFGPQFAAAPMDQKLDALAAKLRKNHFVIVWDNFEVARGIPNTSITANLNDDDCTILRKLLEQLRGGQTKVIITSRAREQWLGHENCYELTIGGLDGDERWQYCQTVLKDLGKPAKRDDPEMIELMDLLGGHPLAMRAILPLLRDRTAGSLAAALRDNLAALDLPEDEVSAKLAATLRFVEDSLPDEQRPLLIPLSLHEAFVDADYLEEMAKRVDNGPTRAVIDRFTAALGVAGLLRDRGQAIFELHPALTGYLRAAVARGVDPGLRDAWTRAFVDVMGGLADVLTPLPLHEQRVPFHIHGANFHHALTEAERMGMDVYIQALLQSLGAYALHARDFADAAQLFTRLVAAHKRLEDQEGEAAAYHQLGIIGTEQRDFAAANQWYRAAVTVFEQLGLEQRAANTYHQLGMTAEEQRDFAAAQQWYLKAVTVFEKLGIEQHAANTYHHLGRIAQAQRDFAVAEQWYRKSLAIEEKQGNEQGAAITHGQLGNLAFEQRDFVSADQLYRKAATVFEKLGIEQHAAGTYHQLGMIAQQQRDFAGAEQWYRKAVTVFEKLGFEQDASGTYHQLGRIAEEQRDFASAEQWYRKSLAISEKQGNEHGAARTYGQLGIVAGLQGRFEQSGQWLIKCIQAFSHCNDQHGAQGNTANFMLFYKEASADVQVKLAAMWREAGLGELPDGPDAAEEAEPQ